MLTVIFDLDDTLCDYAAARCRAKLGVDQLLAERGLPAGPKFWERFEKLDPGLFAEFTTGGLSREEYRTRRFELPCRELGALPGTATEAARLANDLFIRSTNTDIELFADAVPTLRALGDAGLTLALLTNGPSDGQRAKIEALGLAPYLHHVFISEEIGVGKPDPRAFATVLHAVGHGPEHAVMVGDSPSSDIAGAGSAGMRAVLIDRSAGPHPTCVETVPSLAALVPLLGPSR